MQKEMTRKEFLGTLGLGLVSLLGFSSVVHLLNGNKQLHAQKGGYGARTYGK